MKISQPKAIAQKVLQGKSNIRERLGKRSFNAHTLEKSNRHVRNFTKIEEVASSLSSSSSGSRDGLLKSSLPEIISKDDLELNNLPEPSSVRVTLANPSTEFQPCNLTLIVRARRDLIKSLEKIGLDTSNVLIGCKQANTSLKYQRPVLNNKIQSITLKAPEPISTTASSPFTITVTGLHPDTTLEQVMVFFQFKPANSSYSTNFIGFISKFWQDSKDYHEAASYIRFNAEIQWHLRCDF